MSTWIKVARYHLIDRLTYLGVPWGALTFSLSVNLVIFAAVRNQLGPHRTGGLATIYAIVFITGLFTVTRSLPLGLAFGISRRSYYFGTVLLGVSQAAVYGLALTGLQAIERATGGWGERLSFFRVPWILDGAWYLTWLTSFVVLTLVFVYGIWFGLVYRRFNLIGLVAFSAAQVTVLVAASLIVTWSHTWSSVGHFFSALSAVGFTGLLAALTVLLLAGGFSTMRRVSV